MRFSVVFFFFEALEYVNEAIEHTPTLVEVYACKARIYKHVRGSSDGVMESWMVMDGDVEVRENIGHLLFKRYFNRVISTSDPILRSILFKSGRERAIFRCTPKISVRNSAPRPANWSNLPNASRRCRNSWQG